MSIELFIKPSSAARDDGALADFFPVATYDYFKRFWMPLAERLHLKYVPLFGTGLPVAAEDVQDVVGELSTLRESLEALGSERNTMSSRIDIMIRKLKEAQSSAPAEIYIGWGTTGVSHPTVAYLPSSLLVSIRDHVKHPGCRLGIGAQGWAGCWDVDC